MAGMLPGVEAARRRRIHYSNSCSSLGITTTTSSYSPSRRSSFSLYSPNSATSLSSEPRSNTYQDDEKLGPLAREARERLDEKLRAQRKPIFIKSNNNDQLRSREMNQKVKNEVRRTQVYGSSSGAKRLILGCSKLGRKSGEFSLCPSISF